MSPSHGFRSSVVPRPFHTKNMDRIKNALFSPVANRQTSAKTSAYSPPVPPTPSLTAPSSTVIVLDTQKITQRDRRKRNNTRPLRQRLNRILTAERRSRGRQENGDSEDEIKIEQEENDTMVWSGPIWNRQRIQRALLDNDQDASLQEEQRVRSNRRPRRRVAANERRRRGDRSQVDSEQWVSSVDDVEPDVSTSRVFTDRQVLWQRNKGGNSPNVVDTFEAKRVTSDKPSESPDTKVDLKEGTRVKFSAKHQSTRSLAIYDELLRELLNDYMTQPVEQYSLLSFHELHDKTETRSRRWLVRRLTVEEAAFYHNDCDAESHYSHENFFRLAVPLMPLVGLDLTPVIDLAVDVNVTTSRGSDIGESTSGRMQDGNQGDYKSVRNRWGWRRRKIEEDEVRIRSLRVALLSTEEEVNQAMGGKPYIHGELIKNSDTLASVQRMGYEAIGMVGRLEKNMKPHVSFAAVISWSDGGNPIEEAHIRVKTEVTTSLTIPPLPIPFPSSLVVGNIGSVLTRKALALVLPHFLKKLEDDFRRWASVE